MKRKLLSCVFGAALAAGTAFGQGTFRHPGLLHSEADFESIRERVAAGDADMTAALEGLRNSRGITNPGNTAVNETIIRGITGENYMNAYRNAALAYQCALMWKITGETSYADRAVDVLNAYRLYNKALGGNTNISLISGFNGYQFANAAELMRDYRSDAWGEEEFELFKQYLIDVWFTVAQDFLERRHDTVTNEGNWYHYHSNWGLGNALFCVSLGILCDLPDIYNYGMYWIKEGPGNESLCVTMNHPDTYTTEVCGFGWGLIPWFHADERGPLGYLNQMQESGRDQGHSMAALGLLSYALQSAYNQGDNAFCNLNNMLVTGKAGSAMVAGAAEYVAAYNTGYDDLPFKTNWWMTGLNATGRGQFRPIWQLFINHYENRMGIPMQFCHEMEDAIGLELGGGSYGSTSGGYDHLGFGDLMHTDAHSVSADEVPTILFPQITSTTETRNYAEISSVEPGSVLMLSVSLPDGETDTGQWTWEDGATGSQRQVTADRSGLWRVVYTNANGVESTQLFSIAVRGDGIRATLTATAVYNGQTIACADTTDLLVGVGRPVVLSTAYTNWNYIESEMWYDEDGTQIGTGGTYTYTLTDNETHRLEFQLVNQSGVVLTKVFNIIPNENDLTSLLPDPDCENPDLWTADVEGFQRQTTTVEGFSQPFIERVRDASADGMDCWGQERFNISQQLTGLQAGKYELCASVVATQQTFTDETAKSYVKDVYLYAGGVHTAVSTLDGVSERFTVTFYVGEDGAFTFGVENLTDQDRGYSPNGMNWFAMDNFSLEYLGTDDLDADLEALRAEAAAVSADSVPAALYERLAALVSASDGVETAVALLCALDEVKLIGAHYDEYQAAAAYYEEFLAGSAVKDETLAAALADFGEAGTAEEYYEAYEALDAAWNAFLPNAGQAADVTRVLQNAALSATSGDSMYDTDSRWRTEADGGNFRVFAIDGSDADRGEAQGVNMIERWCTANFTVGERLIYQSVSELPAGRYVFRAAAQKAVEGGAIELFSNDAAVPVMGVARLVSCEAVGEVTDGVLSVGLRSADGNACQWTSLADPSLTYYSPVMLLEEALAAADTLDYGTDNGNALQAAVSAATGLLASGTAAGRMQAWQELCAAMEQYRLDNASAAHPVDMTAQVANAGFDHGNTSGWTLTSADQNYPQFSQGVMEFWHTSFDISQTVTGLPTGNYRVSLQARSDLGTSNNSFRLYATPTGGTPVLVYTTHQTRADGTDTSLHLGQNAEELNADPGLSRVQTSNIFVADGRLTLGAACTRTDMWCLMNDFVLTYLGMDDDDLLANWEAQVAVAKAISRDSIPEAVAALLDTAVDVDATAVSSDSLSQALALLMAEIENARSVMVEYRSYVALREIVGEIMENSEPTLASSLTLLQSNVATADRSVEAATTTTAVRSAYNTLESARQTYVVNATPLNGISFDMTFKVANAECTTDGSWLNDGTVNFRTLVNTAQNGEYTGGVFYENWISPGSEWTDGARPFYQEVTGLPNGNYRLTAAAFRKVELSDADAGATDISLYLNAGRTEVTSTVLDYFTVDGAVTSRTAEIGLISGAGNTANWVGLVDVQLLYFGSEDMVLDETDRSVPDVQDGTYGNVTVRQSLSGGVWNMVCLPFDLSLTQVRNRFDDVKELTGLSVDGDECDLQFTDVRTMSAGVPYLVQVSQSLTEQTYENVTLDVGAIAGGATEVSDGTVTARLAGTSCVTALGDGNFYTYSSNEFTEAAYGQEVNGFRAFLEIEGASPSRLNLYVDGVLTAVREVKAKSADAEVDVYTTDGKRLRSGVKRSEALRGLPSGIYVIDGRKVLK